MLPARGNRLESRRGKGRARGAHPYLVTPEHTANARATLGQGPSLLPEQTVIFCNSAEEARTIGTDWLQAYLALPNYANNLLRTGFSADDLAQVSDRLFDAIIAWGDEEAITRRLAEHFSAGADHVCVQVLLADQTVLPRQQWRRLAAACRT
jgi:probable F420-dependent oxidoreductase